MHEDEKLSSYGQIWLLINSELHQIFGNFEQSVDFTTHPTPTLPSQCRSLLFLNIVYVLFYFFIERWFFLCQNVNCILIIVWFKLQWIMHFGIEPIQMYSQKVDCVKYMCTICWLFQIQRKKSFLKCDAHSGQNSIKKFFQFYYTYK